MRTPPRSTAPRVPFALLVIGLLVGGLVLLLALNTASAANELRRGEFADQDQEVSASTATLRNEVAASAAPAALARAAQALGMVPAGNPAFIVELANGRTVLRGHAKPVADDPLDLPVAIPRGTTHTAAKPTTRGAKSQPSTGGSPSGTKPSSKSTPRSTGAPSTSSNSPSGSTSPAGSRSSGTHSHRTAHHHRSATHESTPTPTPTPTITLPGGNK